MDIIIGDKNNEIASLFKLGKCVHLRVHVLNFGNVVSQREFKLDYSTIDTTE